MDFRSFARRAPPLLIGLALPLASLASFWIAPPLLGIAGLMLTLLLLAVLFVITLAIMLLLLAALAYVHAIGSASR